MKFKLGILSLVSLLGLTSCSNELFYYDSLDKYVEQIEEQGIGYSIYELDMPELLLPSNTFITDYEYTNGSYKYYESGWFEKKHSSTILILTLTYSNEIYVNAKEFAVANLDLTSKNKFIYNNYYFFENMAHPKHYGTGKNGNLDENGNNKFFPCWFTMFSYNDVKNILIFMGYYDELSKEEQTKILNNWEYFLVNNYGKYYDFTK